MGVAADREIAPIETAEEDLRTSWGELEVTTWGRDGFSSATSVLVSLSDVYEASLAVAVVVLVAPLPRRIGVERPVPLGEPVMLLFFLLCVLLCVLRWRERIRWVDSDSSLSLA